VLETLGDQGDIVGILGRGSAAGGQESEGADGAEQGTSIEHL
jgi:hypothetical protein